MSEFWRSIAPSTADTAPIAAAPTVRGVALRLARASAIYGLASFGTRSAKSLLIPVYTRYLTPTDYGSISLAESVGVFALLCGNLAVDSAIQRFYFQHRKDSVELGSYLGSVLRLALSTIVTLVFVGINQRRIGAGVLPAVIGRRDLWLALNGVCKS
jgi:O-antigen/teichoic acid export membrane protein